jgi:hypothetical protein
MGFSKAGLHARMNYEPVAFQAGKMRSHSVVGQAQLFCEFVYRPVSYTQKVQDPASRTFEQPLPPAYMFHRTKDHGRQKKVKRRFD